MKRFLLLVLVAALTAGAIWYALRSSQHTSSATVTALLPRETLAFVHLPDFTKSRAALHQTDLYQIWREPAVQEFLQKPRAKIPTKGSVGQTIQQWEALEMKDAFLAVVSLEYSAWKIVGGFRFKGDPGNAETMVANWKTQLLGNASDIKHETVEYQGHQIQADSAGIVNLSTVRAGQWIFVANDLEQLKPLLDRADGRLKDAKTTLGADEVCAAAFRHMPSSYAAVGYARVDRLVEKLAAPEKAGAPDQMSALRQIRSFCGATSFDGGKIRDTFFVGMPKLVDAGRLTRASLSLGTKDTFLYAAGFLNLSKELQLTGPGAFGAQMSGLQKITGALSAHGITLETWNSAFGPEFGLVGDWPATSHWPALLAALPVKDAAQANKILTTITTAPEEGEAWTREEKEGVSYFTTQRAGNFFSLSPTLGLSDRMLIGGADRGSVEAAMKRSASGGSELGASRNFQNAERLLPTAEQGFVYIDPALIYARVDAALRPWLFMGAALAPGMSDTVDLTKLPAPEVITRHLSPIALSQSYDRDGYVAESVGPVTVYQTVLGTAALGGAAAVLYRKQARWLSPGRANPSLSPTPVAPSPSPDNTP